MRIIDCTLTLRRGMRGVDWQTARTMDKDGWNARTLQLYSHCGTHMDSPLHFDAGDQTIDEIPIGDCVGPAWIADVGHIAERTPITVADLGPVADHVTRGDALILRTGWSRHVDDPDRYRDCFAPLSEALAQWIVDRGVRMVGVEPPSVADVNDLPSVTRIHKILLGAGVIIVEGLTNLDQIDASRCTFAALPLKVHRGDGAPCRAVAILDADGASHGDGGEEVK